MIAEGTYAGKPKKWGTAKTDKGSEYVSIETDITHEQLGSEWTKVAKVETRTVRLYLTPGAWPFTKKKLVQLGFNGDFGENMDFSDETKKVLKLQCAHKEYDNKPREKWELAWDGTQSHTEAPEDAIANLNRLWVEEGKSDDLGLPVEPGVGTDCDDGSDDGGSEIPF